MNKESWYAAKLSDMDVVTISYTDDWVVDYDKSRGMYRVSYFQDNHFVDECWFDAYEEKEVDDRIEKIVEKLEAIRDAVEKTNYKWSSTTVAYLISKLIDYIKANVGRI